MSIKSKLALVAALTTLVAAPAFAIDQQASTEASQVRVQATVPAGAYAAAPRGERFVQPAIVQPTIQSGTASQYFQAVGSH